MSLVPVLGTLAVGLSIAFAWPQAVRARRAHDVSGISAPSTLLLVLTSTTWLGYGLAIGDLAVIAGNGVALTAAAVTLAVLIRRDAVGDAPLLPLVAAWAVVLASLLAAATALGWGSAPVGMFGAVLGISMTIPQAWRASRGHGTGGVSLLTHLLLMAVMATWLLYGLLVADPVIWIPNVLGVTVVGTVVAVLVRHGDPASVLAPAP
jgi:uncharacterized protein with PQ loop repeat